MPPCFKLANIIAMVCDVSITSLNRLFSTDASWCYKSQLPRYKIYLVRIVKNKIRKWKPFRKHEAYREPRKSFLLIGQKLGNKINVFPGKKIDFWFAHLQVSTRRIFQNVVFAVNEDKNWDLQNDWSIGFWLCQAHTSVLLGKFTRSCNIACLPTKGHAGSTNGCRKINSRRLVQTHSSSETSMLCKYCTSNCDRKNRQLNNISNNHFMGFCQRPI